MRVLFAVAVAAGGASVLASGVGCGGRFVDERSDAAADASRPPPTPGPAADARPLPDPPPTPFQVGSEDAAGPSVCMPGAVDDFAVQWKPPPSTHPAACSSAQIAAGITACFGTNATPASCKAWRATGAVAACIECIVGPVGARSWNPVVEISGDPKQPTTDSQILNVAGCIATIDPSNVACAQAVQAALECDMVACIPPCPLPKATPPNETLDVVQGCFQEADTTVCAIYASAASACTADAGAASFCLQAPQNDGALTQFLTAACGTAAEPDAGTDGG